jgi:multisubunit Na+/H+ antiporter MnhG subunit
MSRDEALWIAQRKAEFGVAGCFFAIIFLIIFAILLVSIGEYLYAAVFLALIPLALYCMRRAHRFAQVYAREREKAAADARAALSSSPRATTYT